jgi:hypothetical protein
VQFAECLRIHVAGHLREPIVPAAKEREYGGERQRVVEMGRGTSTCRSVYWTPLA